MRRDGKIVSPRLENPACCVYVVVQIKTLSVKVLVDTGAPTNCITKNIYENHREELRRLESVETIVTGADGSALRIAGRAQLVILVWGHASCRVSFLVLGGLEGLKGALCT